MSDVDGDPDTPRDADIQRAMRQSLDEYRDRHGTWWCLHEACSDAYEPFESEWDLGCHARSAHSSPGPLPIPSDVARIVLRLCRSRRHIHLLACLDRTWRRLVRGDLMGVLERSLPKDAAPGVCRRVTENVEVGWYETGRMQYYDESRGGKPFIRYVWDRDGRLHEASSYWPEGNSAPHARRTDILILDRRAPNHH